MRTDKGEKKTAAQRTKERAQRREGHNRGSSAFKLPDDANFLELKKKMRLDVLPYRVTVDNHPDAKKGELWYERTFHIHRGIGPEQQTVICLKTIGKKCPICEEWIKLRRDPDAEEDVVKALKPSERQAFNVIDLDNPKKGVQLFTISTAMFGDMLEEEIRDGDDEIAGFWELKGGKTLEVLFREKSIGKSNFMETRKISFEDRDTYEKDILEEVMDLDAIFNLLSYEDLEKLFKQDSEDEEEPEEEDEDDDDEEKPRHKKGKKPHGKDDADEDEDSDDGDDDAGEEDEDDADESDDDEEDDEEPRKKHRKPSAHSRDSEDDADEDEDEDEDPDDDDEDDEPKKRKKVSKKSSAEDEEDEEDESEEGDDEVEEEADERPKKGKKSGSRKDEDDEDDE